MIYETEKFRERFLKAGPTEGPGGQQALGARVRAGRAGTALKESRSSRGTTPTHPARTAHATSKVCARA